jgi:hypothetical protein
MLLALFVTLPTSARIVRSEKMEEKVVEEFSHLNTMPVAPIKPLSLVSRAI